ncbi:hypothetical protein [Burkholderia ubonensis]|uniref:hypothetical protein n=1 Tax=Burkholderia ubonensis TaxID=101571 RepID=UPI0018E03FD7|nr:hypothetical protein [Burkholderia ubonensis]
MTLAKVDSVAVSSSGALNVSVCDRKKHPASFKLPFADLETINAYFREKSLTKAPRTDVRGEKNGSRRRVCSLRHGAAPRRTECPRRSSAGGKARHRRQRDPASA